MTNAIVGFVVCFWAFCAGLNVAAVILLADLVRAGVPDDYLPVNAHMREIICKREGLMVGIGVVFGPLLAAMLLSKQKPDDL